MELFYHLLAEGNGRIPTREVFYEKFYKKSILNHVFGTVIHRLHYTGGMKRLRELSGMVKENDFEVLNTFFPSAKFIYFYRDNKVKQAISFLKAERSRHYTFKDNPEFGEYSKKEISKYITHLCISEAQWSDFFTQYGINPYVLSYESLCSNTEGSLRNVLDFLDFDASKIEIDESDLPIRQYNEISEDWYQIFLKSEPELR